MGLGVTQASEPNISIIDPFSIPAKALFHKARSISASHCLLTTSSIVIDTCCETQPVCNHCPWEYDRTVSSRFALDCSIENVVAEAHRCELNGVTRLVLSAGWSGYSLPSHRLEYVRAVREATSLELYGNFGALDARSVFALSEAGLDGYFCSLESPNDRIYRSVRPGGASLPDRIVTLNAVRSLGLCVWSGFLCGLGESEEDVLRGIDLLDRFEADSITIIPFIPCPDTGMESANPANPMWFARVMAAVRIRLPKAELFSVTPDRFTTYGRYAELVGPNGFDAAVHDTDS